MSPASGEPEVIQNRIVEVWNPAHARVPEADRVEPVKFPRVARADARRPGFLEIERGLSGVIDAGLATGYLEQRPGSSFLSEEVR
jgi:hypothetical protein